MTGIMIGKVEEVPCSSKQGKDMMGNNYFRKVPNFARFWFDNKLHGEGRMIYSNGDVYEG